MPDRPPSDYIERLSEQWEPRLRAAFLAAVAEIAGRINISALTRMLERGDIPGALRLVGIDPSDFSLLSLEQARAFHETGMQAARTIPPLRLPEGQRLEVRFDVRNPLAEAWVREHSSRLVQEIVDDQLVAVRQHLEVGLERGLNPRTVALDLVGRQSRVTGQREGGVIGLHSQQERWIARYAEDLASDDPAALRRLLARGLRDKRFDRSVLKAIREGRGLPADLQAKMRLAYANRALKWRADNIARTETMRALGAAQTQAWEQGIEKGVVERGDIRRYWVTAGDERVRHTHRLIPGLNKAGVGWDEPFRTPTGFSMHAPHDTDMQCRCRERIAVDHLGAAIRRVRAAA